MPQHATLLCLDLFPSLPGILKYDCHVLNLSRAAGESDALPNCGICDVGYGLGMGILVQPVSNAIAIVAWHNLNAFYFRRRLLMRSAKLLGSAGLTSVYGALSSPNAS
jgi:hypothetical protein